jgi:hypothetical protein
VAYCKDELGEICQHIGIGYDGWVPAEDFNVTYVRYKKARKDWIKGCRTAEDWPFSGPIVDEGAKEEEGSLFRRLFRFRLF